MNFIHLILLFSIQNSKNGHEQILQTISNLQYLIEPVAEVQQQIELLSSPLKLSRENLAQIKNSRKNVEISTNIIGKILHALYQTLLNEALLEEGLTFFYKCHLTTLFSSFSI